MGMQLNMETLRRGFVVGALTGLLAACGSAAQSAPPTTDGHVIELRDNQFYPAALTVPVGTTVTWWWNDGIFGGHDLVMSDVFTVPEQTGGTFPQRFDTPGTYTYVCTLHDGMTGTLIVDAASATAPVR